MNYDFFYTESLIGKFKLTDINNLAINTKSKDKVNQLINSFNTNNTYKNILFDAYRFELNKVDFKKTISDDSFPFEKEILKFKTSQSVLLFPSKKFDEISFVQDGIFFFDYADYDFSYILMMSDFMLKKVVAFEPQRAKILLKFFPSVHDFLEIPIVKWNDLVFSLYQTSISPKQIINLILNQEKFNTIYRKGEISARVRNATKKLLFNGIIKVDSDMTFI